MAKKNEVTKNVDDIIQESIALIEKNMGVGSIMMMGDKSKVDVESISTGSLKIDKVLGIGGFPKGRIIEIFGPESSGKTTIALHTIASCQKNGGRAAFIDAEHAIDPDYAAKLGVDIENLLLSQPDCGEQALDICEILARSAAIDLIVVDSVAALVPRAELEGEITDQQIGLQARLMSKALRKLAGVLNKSNCTIIFINQLRDKIASGPFAGAGETTSGGRALKFFASVRMDIRKTEAIRIGEEIIGNKVKVKIVKNKVSPPFKTVSVDMIYGEGVSYFNELIDLAVEFKFVDKAGSWFSYEGNKLGQGKENVKAYLKDNPQIVESIEEKVKNHLNSI